MYIVLSCYVYGNLLPALENEHSVEVWDERREQCWKEIPREGMLASRVLTLYYFLTLVITVLVFIL